MAKIAGIATAIIIFLIWHSLIGNPHVIETIIGLILASAGGIWAYLTVKKLRS
jgi:hypothetical protein